MKKLTNKKGFTLVELLAVIVILAILMAIAATNIGPVIDNSRRSSMRTTAQMIIEAVQTQLTANFELYAGTYQWDTSILDRGGISAPFGGEYKYAESQPSGSTKIGSGIYRIATTPTTIKNDGVSGANCKEGVVSFLSVTMDTTTLGFKYNLRLSTSAGGYLSGERKEIDDNSSANKDKIFHGKASPTGQK